MVNIVKIVNKFLTESKKQSQLKKEYKWMTHDKFVVPSIDRDRYPNREHEGLEGPYRHRKSGKIYYYDHHEGKYYDPNSDIYSDVTSMTEHLASNATAKDYIDDFLNSNNPEFKGKSKLKRRQMAIAAYMSHKTNESFEPNDDKPNEVDDDDVIDERQDTKYLRRFRIVDSNGHILGSFDTREEAITFGKSKGGYPNVRLQDSDKGL